MDDNNENLFFKVFNNVYIRRVIFQKIEEINISTGCKRKKFKDINSLEWIVEKKMFSLLKCKLIACETIEITKKSLSDLFLSFQSTKKYKVSNETVHIGRNGYFKCIGEYKRGDEFIDDGDESDNDDTFKEKENRNILIKELVVLLFKFKLNEIFSFGLMDIVIDDFQNSYYSEMVGAKNFKYLIDTILAHPISCTIPYIINSLTIEITIKSLSPSVLKKMVSHLRKNNNFNEVYKEVIKNYSISMALRNKRYRQVMVDFILNDPELYNTTFTISNKKLKSSKSTSQSSSQKQLNKNITKIDFTELFELSSISANRLVELGYLKPLQKDHYIKFNCSDELKLQELELLKCKEEKEEEQDEEEPLKKVFKFYLENVRKSSFYIEYLIIYDEPIDKLDDGLVLKYSLHSKSYNGLKYLLSKDKEELIKLKKSASPSNYRVKEKPFTISNEINQFIKLYTTGYQYFKDGPTNKKLIEFIYSVKSNQEFTSIYKSIVKTDENKEFTEIKIPNCWSTLSLNASTMENIKNKYSFHIQDQDTVDLIQNNMEYFKKLKQHYWHKNKSLSFNISFNYETPQLIKYNLSKYGSNLTVTEIDIEDYVYPFSRAINNCDIESLKYIEHLFKGKNLKFNYFKSSSTVNESKFSKTVLKKLKEMKEINGESSKLKINFNYQTLSPSPSPKVIQLIDYLNLNGYRLFTTSLFKDFLNDISKLDKTIVKLENLKINFNGFENEAQEFIIESITDNVRSNIVLVVLNNYNPFSTELNIKSFIEKWDNLDKKHLIESSYFYILFEEHKKVYQQSSIYTVFNGYESHGPDGLYGAYDCKTYESSNDIIIIIQSLLNHLKNNDNNGLTNSTITKLFNLFQSMINYLFKRLIKADKVTIDQVTSIHHLIKSKWLLITGVQEFQFQHSLYHIFFFLRIRSSELTKYIMDQPEIFNFLSDDCQDEYSTDNYDYENQEEYYDYDNQEDILKRLKPDLFSYQFIFNSQFQDLFDSLKTSLNSTPTTNKRKIDNQNSKSDDESY